MSRYVVKNWNRDNPVGTPVRYWPGVREGDGKPATTRKPAQLIGGHTAVVWVTGETSFIRLTHVEPAERAA